MINLALCLEYITPHYVILGFLKFPDIVQLNIFSTNKFAIISHIAGTFLTNSIIIQLEVSLFNIFL